MPDAETVKTLRAAIRASTLSDEARLVPELVAATGLSARDRQRIAARAAELVETVRVSAAPKIMESFLAEYGLNTTEGIALMCLAEALLRVPDAETIDALISDKIVPSHWGRHLGHSSSSLVNASTWALMLTGKVLTHSDEHGLVDALHDVIRRLGEPVVRTAVTQAMRELGRQFVLGQTIEEAIENARPREEQGCVYSYDMLGEAARTEADARRYHLAYSNAIGELARLCGADITRNPGVSVKLSALHPRYEYPQRSRVMGELAPRLQSLALLAKSANMGLNVDAEEADRLDLSLDVIEAVLSDPALAGWDGFGIVVQAYGPRAGPVVEWLYALARHLGRRIMVRLVKGAYWDSEIKRAQVLGLDGFPVFTRKANTDVSYLACVRKLLGMTDRLYPQFATHNAHSVAAILDMAENTAAFEFQRLHGMGEALHDAVLERYGTHCRIYAPVGAHRDLLAYLVRRLLENGANSSFVNRIVDTNLAPADVARDPIEVVERHDADAANPVIPCPSAIFGTARKGARGRDITDPAAMAELDAGREQFRTACWHVAPESAGRSAASEIRNPADPDDLVGRVENADPAGVPDALSGSAAAFEAWSRRGAGERASYLERSADLYEAHAEEFFALAAREAGKTLPDAIAEVREAVDFLRYYAVEARRLDRERPGSGRGVFICISPWNFPLAIFTGQIAAALAAGNTVVAKPAEQTPLIAARAVRLMHEAGIPKDVLQFLPGGSAIGARLVSDPRIAGVCFTGSVATARIIDKAMAAHCAPDAVLVAETGGLNAMIADSTALPEQAVRDVVASAFQSAGQRCSALRILYIQNDVKEHVLQMLFGAMSELRLGDPWDPATDVGPVIDEDAEQDIASYCGRMARKGRQLFKLDVPARGRFVAPTVLEVSGIEELEREIFGPVLHVAGFEAREIDAVVDTVNRSGYGLTFGLHTRVDSRVQQVVDRLAAGNLYVNRNQIGAVVGSQPFGGEGLSGTGPKAGGPYTLVRLQRYPGADWNDIGPIGDASVIPIADVQAAFDGLQGPNWRTRDDRVEVLHQALSSLDGDGPVQRALDEVASIDTGPKDLPGPTGESNRLSLHPRGATLCLGPSVETALIQGVQALALGNAAVLAAPGVDAVIEPLTGIDAPVAALNGVSNPADLTSLPRVSAVASAADPETLRALRIALAARDGEIVPLITEAIAPHRYLVERHLCIDTTAAGGNASLLAAAGD